jgi:hypothetical protein
MWDNIDLVPKDIDAPGFGGRLLPGAGFALPE